MTNIPLIDLSKSEEHISKKIHDACIEHGFFYIKNHGIDIQLQNSLEKLAALFFDLPLEKKMEISMKKGGKAWRGYFPLLDELTSNKPDLKEGIYFGEELADNHPKVIEGVPMHGKNLFPNQPPELRNIVLNYMDEMTNLGHRMMQSISLSLGLDKNYFKQNYTDNPFVLFRIFHYPPSATDVEQKTSWGVGEHTDYGLLTILKQDEVGGLQVKSKNSWIDAPYIENTFICNIGDMLDKLTGGYYVSTPHRVKNVTNNNRYSYPFFFDPNFDAKLNPINLGHLNHSFTTTQKRWDNSNIHDFEGTYGDYILNKVAKVFPEL